MSRRALSVILFVCGFHRVSDCGADRGHIAGQDGKKEVRRSPRPPPQKPALLFILKSKKRHPFGCLSLLVREAGLELNKGNF